MTITLDSGTYEPKDTDSVVCEKHNIRTVWGELSPIAQMAVEAGIDTDDECLLTL